MSLLVEALRQTERAQQAGDPGGRATPCTIAGDQRLDLELEPFGAPAPPGGAPSDVAGSAATNDEVPAVTAAAATGDRPAYAARTVFVAKGARARRARLQRVAAYGALTLLLGGGIATHVYDLYQSMAHAAGVTPLRPAAPPSHAEPLVVPAADGPPTPIAGETADDPPTEAAAAAQPAVALRPSERKRTGMDRADPALSTAAIASPAAITITRRTLRAPNDPLLAEGYAAYHRGETQQAREAFSRALAHVPDDRNALLGLAAMAVREGEIGQARALYLRLLDRDAGDVWARFGLLAIDPPSDPIGHESELKRLLATEPQAAQLHFALGNLYASNRRWGEAQHAYFNALQADAGGTQPKPPDYAFNLAVTLEHLGKDAAAADYYRRALALAARLAPSFDPALARARIAALTGERAPPP